MIAPVSTTPTPDNAPDTGAPDEPRFDVYVRPSPWAHESALRERALQAGLMAEAPLDKLLQALRERPRVKIASELPASKVQAYRQRLTQIGFTVDLAPVLALQEKVAAPVDPREECPACGEKAILGPERQCPACGVFVDKVTPEQRLRRKILEEERDKLLRGKELDAQRLRSKLEAELRQRIRAELEKEMRAELEQERQTLAQASQGRFGRWGQAVKAVIGLAALGTTFAFGHWQGVVSKETTPVAYTGPVDRLLSVVGPLAAASAALADPANLGASKLAKGDSLVAQAQSAQAQGQVAPLGKAISERTGLPMGSGRPGDPVQEVSAEQKARLGVEFVQALARSGQALRARDLFNSLKEQPAWAGQPAIQALFQSVDWELRAWALNFEPVFRRKTLLDGLSTEVAAIADPLQRTRSQVQVGAALSQIPSLPPEAGQAFFVMAQTSMAAIGDPAQQAQARGDFMLGSAQVMWAESQTKARAGAWTRVRELQTQFDTLVAQSPDKLLAAQIQSLSIRNRLLLGEQGEASQALAAALAEADQEAAWANRARILRHLAGVGDLAVRHERFLQSLAKLDADVASAPALVQAEVFQLFALIYADMGQKEAQEMAAKRAWSVPGLSATERIAVSADVLTQTEIAASTRQRQLRAYNQAEPHIQQVTQYLLL